MRTIYLLLLLTLTTPCLIRAQDSARVRSNSLILSAGNAQGPFFLPQPDKFYPSSSKFVLYAGIRYLRQARKEWFQYGLALHMARRPYYYYFQNEKYLSIYLDPTVRFNLSLLRNKLRLFAEPGLSIQMQFYKGGNRDGGVAFSVAAGATYTLDDRFFLELRTPIVEEYFYIDDRPIRSSIRGRQYQWRPATLGIGYKF